VRPPITVHFVTPSSNCTSHDSPPCTATESWQSRRVHMFAFKALHSFTTSQIKHSFSPKGMEKKKEDDKKRKAVSSLPRWCATCAMPRARVYASLKWWCWHHHTTMVCVWTRWAKFHQKKIKMRDVTYARLFEERWFVYIMCRLSKPWRCRKHRLQYSSDEACDGSYMTLVHCKTLQQVDSGREEREEATRETRVQSLVYHSASTATGYTVYSFPT